MVEKAKYLVSIMSNKAVFLLCFFVLKLRLERLLVKAYSFMNTLCQIKLKFC